MYSIAISIENPVKAADKRKKYKKRSLKTLFSFEKKVPFTTLRVQFKPWNIA